MIRALIVEDDFRVAELHRTYTATRAPLSIGERSRTVTGATKATGALTSEILARQRMSDK
jgi:response regulator of citrate/malate metabolism